MSEYSAHGGEVLDMAKDDIVLDLSIYERASSLFAAKRRDFGPEAIESLASDIVRRLAQSSRGRSRWGASEISDESVEAFCDVLIKPDPSAALRFIEERRAEGVTRHAVYLGFIGAAARRLGEGWEEDRLSFAEVTFGTGHLYALIRALRTEQLWTSTPFDRRKCALFATVPGEDHGIGITVATDLFRDDGWEIDLRIDTDHDDLLAEIEETQPHIIGLSLSTERRLDALMRLVVAIRLVMPGVIIGVAPGGDLDPKHLQDLVDIDLVFGDAPSACRELERLVRLRD